MKTFASVEIKKRRQQRIKQLFHSQPDHSWNEWRHRPSWNPLMLKLVVCVIIYAAVWVLFQIHQPFAESAKDKIRIALTRSLNFEVAADWYSDHLGGWPALLPKFDSGDQATDSRTYTVPVNGWIVSPYSVTSRGIWLSTKPNQTVSAIGTGLVESVNRTPDTGLTVMIRHSDGMRSIYGWLENVSVEVNEWLKGGSEIGIVKSETNDQSGKFYFALTHNAKYVNPGDVIPFD